MAPDDTDQIPISLAPTATVRKLRLVRSVVVVESLTEFKKRRMALHSGADEGTRLDPQNRETLMLVIVNAAFREVERGAKMKL